MKIFILILIIFSLLVFVYQNQIIKFLKSSKLPEVKEARAVLKEIKKEISNPPPLRGALGTQKSFLTQQGVIKWTNIQREKVGLADLTENAVLDQIADFKLRDMFLRQYFEHVSLSGVDVSGLAKKFDYKFIVIGENLALGNFKNDEILVDAWMASPGHRANILNKHFREIGVAVGKGQFEGHTTYLAVQSFAAPLSSCPQVDENLKTQIDSVNAQIDALTIQANNLKSEIENSQRPRTKEEVDAYNQKIDEYNALVNQINNLIVKVKILVSQYNGEVDAYNTCLAS